MFQQHPIDYGNAKKDRWTVCAKNLTDYFRHWFLSAENCGEAVQQRKRESVAEPVRKGKTRRREQAIAFAQSQHLAAIGFICVADVRLSVDHTFRFAGAARGVKNEGFQILSPANRQSVTEWQTLRIIEPLHLHSGS